ncbi:MAG: hypothetical protein LBR95_01435, partial [Azoarcus sp.]|nr:hypothetical protein [Azoarcus sp.]
MAEETTDKTILWTSSKKVLLRRAGTMNGILSWRDWRTATTWRRAAQTVLVLLNIYLCAAFYFWARHFETGATGAPPMRPEG